MEKKEFPEEAKKRIISLFFKSLNNLEKIIYLKEGFTRKGYNAETFY